MARKKKITTKQGGIKVTLTKEYVYENGLKIEAGKTPTVSNSFYTELKAGGYLDPVKPINKK